MHPVFKLINCSYRTKTQKKLLLRLIDLWHSLLFPHLYLNTSWKSKATIYLYSLLHTVNMCQSRRLQRTDRGVDKLGGIGWGGRGCAVKRTMGGGAWHIRRGGQGDKERHRVMGWRGIRNEEEVWNRGPCTIKKDKFILDSSVECEGWESLMWKGSVEWR